MKTMIRSFASALVAVLTFGLVQTARAEVFPIGDPVVDPEGACEVNCPSEAEEASRVEFTLSNFAQGVQVDTVKVVPTYWGEPFDADYDYDKECYYFQMPNENVYIEVYCSSEPEPGTDYSITIPAFKGGSVTSDVPSAEAGAPVTLTVTPDKGYELASIVVVGDGVTIDPKKGEGSTYTFTMPDSDVEVQATFKEKLYNINIPEFKGGTVTSNVASTNEGATVTLTVTPDPGYELDTIKVDGIEPTKGEGSTYTFEMPNHDVEVAATFKEATKYKINTSVTPSEACEVHVKDSAQSGEEVYFELHFAAGATLGSLTVWNTSVGGVPVEYQQSGKGYTFKMPDGDVLIQVFCSDPEPPKDPEITGVTAQQRYPWNGLVDIGYTVTGTVPDGYVLKVSAMDMKTYDTFDAKTITAEEFPLSEGTHKLKWDMNADGYTTTVSDSVRFRVEAVSLEGGVGTMSGQTKVDLRTGTTREIALGATETLTYSTDYEGGPTPPKQEGVQLWENGPYFAETNIGAKNPQDYGYYFWWGDTVGYQYSDMAWTAVDGSGKVITFDDNAPANSTYGLDLAALIDNKWIDETSHNLVPEHDAATAHLDKPWRMPTSAEMETLCSDVCDWKAVTDEDGNLIGYMVSGREAYAGNSIFLPAAGCGDGSDILHLGESGGYWSSTPHASNSELATAIDFESWYYSSSDLIRFIGRPIRPVRSATASAAANGASNEGETVTITVNGKTLKSGLSPSGKVDWTPTEPGEYVLNHIVNSADGSTEITNLVARYNVQAPTTTVVQVWPIAQKNTSVGGVYTNGVEITATAEGTYPVNLNATVDVVFNADAGYFFKKDGAYTPVVTNTTTAAADPTEVFGPGPNQGTQVGDGAYAFVDGNTCTIVGSGTADTRLSTVVSPGAITSAVIQPGITEIGARFFKDFKWLNAVTGGQDLKTVGEKAFYKCFSLETIDLDCTAVPEGMDESVVYQTALKSDGSTYQIPEISVKNHVKMLFGKKSLDDADWTCLGPSEGKSIYEQGGYQFFQIRLVPEK